MSKLSTPWIARFLEKDGEMLYLIVEQVNDEDVDGTLLRFRVHRHPNGTARVATTSNDVIWEESGDQYHLGLLSSSTYWKNAMTDGSARELLSSVLPRRTSFGL